MKKETKWHDLKLIFVEYSLGKYYTYFKNEGKYHHRYPIIEMNISMYKFDKELFYWVLFHELDHKKFYIEEKNWNKSPYWMDLKQHFPNKYNIKMTARLSKFEFKFSKTCYKKDFVTNYDKTMLDSDKTISYYECKTNLTSKEEKEILDFIKNPKIKKTKSDLLNDSVELIQNTRIKKLKDEPKQT